MKTLLKMAWRNIWRNKRRSLISMASVVFAVLFAIAADSLERGSYELKIENMVNFSTGYLQIQDVLYKEEPSVDNMMLYDENIEHILSDFEDEIEYTVPRVSGFALAATDKRTRGVMITGIDPEQENRFNNLSERVVAGAFIQSDDHAVLLAEGLANILELTVGDTLVMIGQGFQGSNAAGMFPIKGIVRLSLPEMNNNFVYLPLQGAQWFYDAQDRVTSLIIMPVKPKNTHRLAGQLQEKLDSEWYSVLTWDEILEDFLRLMKIDTSGNKILIFILYIVIGFGLFGTILTMMLERVKEFAMLIAIGMKRRQLAAICMFESLFLSLTGVITGIAVAFPIVLYFKKNPIPLGGEMADMMADYGFEAVLPASTEPSVFLTQATAILVIALLIGLYPAYKALKMKVIQTVK